MGRPMNDYTNKIFGNLKVLERGPNRTNSRKDIVVTWICECLLCGKKVVIEANRLKKIKNHRDCYIPSLKLCFTKDDKRLHSIWQGIKTRCNNPNASYYYLYGERGINLCDEWKSFTNFRNWALKNGYQDNLSIDRIDNDKGYSPDNCRFVDNITQSRNRRCIKIFTDPYDEEKMPLSGFAKKYNINRETLRRRVNVRKLSLKEALETPTTMGPKPRSMKNASI